MPTPSSSFEGITPLPPGVVSIRAGIFEPPDETGLSVSVPTDYTLYTATEAPSAGTGQNGDWYIYVASNLIRTYRKIVNTWTLVSTISGGGGGGGVNSLNSLSGDLNLVAGSGITITPSGGDTLTITNTGGGGGGDLDNITISNSTFTSGDIDTTNISGGTIAGSTITTPAITGGTITSAAITNTSITGLPNPTNATDAANKQYVDGISSGITTKLPVNAATTANVTLIGGAPNVVDGVTLSAGYRILVKNQTAGAENGIYEVTTLGSGSNGTWTRALDANTSVEMPTGTTTYVVAGTIALGQTWRMITPGPIVLGTTVLEWALVGDASSVDIGTLPGTIVTNQIPNAILQTAMFASSIRPVELVSSMPTTGNTQGRMVFLTADDGAFAKNKLYRWTSDSVSTGTTYWTAAVPAVDITGNLTDSQIADLSAAKLTGQITSTQITDGAISSPKIAAGAIVAGKIASNAVTANEISAGAVTAGKISAGAVTAGTIAANAVVFGTIAAGAVRVDELAAGAVRSDKIGANEVKTINIDSVAITSGKIAAGAVTADKISVTDLSAINANIGTITAGTITSTTSISLSIGSGLSAVNINSAGMTIGGRITMVADGSNPRVRANGVSGYASSYVELNGSNGGTEAFVQASSSAGNVIISGGAVSVSSGADIVVIGSSSAIKGSSGGQINLFGGSSDALDIVCGEQAAEPSDDGALLLKVNGRSVLVNFTNA